MFQESLLHNMKMNLEFVFESRDTVKSLSLIAVFVQTISKLNMEPSVKSGKGTELEN